MAITVKILVTDGDKVLFNTSNEIKTDDHLIQVIEDTIYGLEQTISPLISKVEDEVKSLEEEI